MGFWEMEFKYTSTDWVIFAWLPPTFSGDNLHSPPPRQRDGVWMTAGSGGLESREARNGFKLISPEAG